MRDLTKRFLLALDMGGIPYVIDEVLLAEEEHERTAESEIALRPGFACETIRDSVMEIPDWTFRAIITGRFIRDSLLPNPGQALPSDYEPEIPESQSSQSSHPSQRSHGSGSTIVYVVERIEDAAICEDENDEEENFGHVLYLIKWDGYSYHENSWEPISSLKGCPLKLAQFYKDNPDKPRYGPRDCKDTLTIEGLDLSDISRCFGSTPPPSEHQIIYAHWFVDDTNTSFRGLSPTTTELLRILDVLEFYVTDHPLDHPRRAEHLAIIRLIDQLDDPAGLFPANWPIGDNLNGLRRYLKSQDPLQPVNRRAQQKCLDIIIPTLRSQLELIPIDERDRPYPYPLSEIGYTATAELRKEQHQNHSSSMKIMYCIRAISIHLFGARYRWVFHPIALVRGYSEAKYLEMFFSQLCQSYSWLGGMNTDIAGKSIKSAGEVTTKVQHILKRETLNTTIISQNLDLALSRMGRTLEKIELRNECRELEVQINENDIKMQEVMARGRALRVELNGWKEEKKVLLEGIEKETASLGEIVKAKTKIDDLTSLMKELLAAELTINRSLGLPEQ